MDRFIDEDHHLVGAKTKRFVATPVFVAELDFKCIAIGKYIDNCADLSTP